jgi:hypothetical protein
MKFGTFLYQRSPNSIAAVACKAEESGFESLWIPEHIILPVTYRSPYPYSSSGRMGAPPETRLHDAGASRVDGKVRRRGNRKAVIASGQYYGASFAHPVGVPQFARISSKLAPEERLPR